MNGMRRLVKGTPIIAIAQLVFCQVSLAQSGGSVQQQVRQYRIGNERTILREFTELLAIPNVASDTAGIAANAATYAHYDGQPTDPAKWTGSKPWSPVFRSAALDKGGQTIPLPADGHPIDPDMRIYGRSASDDKAGVMAFLAAIDALKASGRTPSVNLKLVFDGEEEAGSPHLGDMNVDLTVYGATRPLHSGHYGNWAPNPAMTLVQLLASMKDESGRVLIKGWYDDVVPLDAVARKAIREAPIFDDTLRAQLGFRKSDGGGKSLAELINLPSLNINGIASAEVGPGARNVIPTTASATLDLRLVKGNDVKRQMARLVSHIERQGFHVIDHTPTSAERLQFAKIATVTQRGGGYNAQRTAMDLPISRSVFRAINNAFPGRTLAVPTLGGSLPLSIIVDALHVPTITVPIANYDNNQHAEDESIRIGNLWDGIEMMAALMTLN